MEEDPEQQCSENDISYESESLKRYREQVEETYQSIIQTILERNKIHDVIEQYLHNAVNVTRELTLKFLAEMDEQSLYKGDSDV